MILPCYEPGLGVEAAEAGRNVTTNGKIEVFGTI
jgi:hypothetical protein